MGKETYERYLALAQPSDHQSSGHQLSRGCLPKSNSRGKTSERECLDDFRWLRTPTTTSSAVGHMDRTCRNFTLIHKNRQVAAKTTIFSMFLASSHDIKKVIPSTAYFIARGAGPLFKTPSHGAWHLLSPKIGTHGRRYTFIKYITVAGTILEESLRVPFVPLYLCESLVISRIQGTANSTDTESVNNCENVEHLCNRNLVGSQREQPRPFRLPLGTRGVKCHTSLANTMHPRFT